MKSSISHKRAKPSFQKKPKQSRSNDHISNDHIGNDWLETTIIVAVLATMAGAAYFMYLLSQA